MTNKELFISKYKNLHKFEFIHTPKCAGQYFNRFFYKDPLITNLSHTITGGRAKKIFKQKNKTYKFTIIREPISRFQSFLNYCLSGGIFHRSIPSHLMVQKDKNYFNLNLLVENLSDKMIYNGFETFYNLQYWTKNADFIFTIGQFDSIYREIYPPYVEALNNPSFKHKYNKSKKNWGEFDTGTRKYMKGY